MNPPPQKILFLSIPAGLGHVRAAEALQASAEQFHPEIVSRHFNLEHYSPLLINTLINLVYTYPVRYLPKLYGFVYRFDDRSQAPFSSLLDRVITKTLQTALKHLIQDITDFAPTRIITTHYLLPFLLKNKISCPLDVVVTDYYAHRVWLHDNVRTYFVASDETGERLQQNHKTTITSGIPIHPDFLKPSDAALLKQRFGMDPVAPTILLLSGGNGLINTTIFARQILHILPNANLIAITGKNYNRLYHQLLQLKSAHPTLQVFRFVDTIAEWMAAADIIITKPGGITVSEALYLHKPLIMINPIPGQEEKNAEFVEKKGRGILLKQPVELKKVLPKIIASTSPAPQKKGIPPNEIILTYI